ncbi:hypothetical protein OROMI_032443 [Orobanche minor]
MSSKTLLKEGGSIKKTIYISMVDEDVIPICMSVLSVPLKNLPDCFSDDESRSSKKVKTSSSSLSSTVDVNDDKAEVVFISEDDGDLCAGMGLGKLGSKIYVVGGLNPIYFGEKSVKNICSAKVFVFDTATRKLDKKAVPDMMSGKYRPVVFAGRGVDDDDQVLYVLAGDVPCISGIPEKPFEAYNFRTEKWSDLPLPPFMDPESPFCSCPTVRGFALIGGKLYVSTFASSFMYDFDKKLWSGECMLFDNLPPSFYRPFECIYHVSLPYDGSTCGIPFGFRGRAALFGNEDALICTVPYETSVMAFMLGSGGEAVVGSQPLGITISNNSFDSYIAELGGDGLFCVLGWDYDERTDSPTFTLLPFLVTPNESGSANGGQKYEPLLCEAGTKFPLPKDFGEHGECYSPTGCFAI